MASPLIIIEAGSTFDPIGAERLQVVREARRDLEDRVRLATVAQPELLFEQSLDLRPRQGHRHQAVAKRLNGERLAVGNIAITFADRTPSEDEPGGLRIPPGFMKATTAPPVAGAGCRGELGIGNQVSDRQPRPPASTPRECRP